MLLVLIVSVALAATREELARQLDRLQDDPFLARAVLATQVQDVDSGELLYARHADVLLLPASTVKLVTAVAALERLGPDHAFATSFGPGAAVVEGVIAGDLVVVGSGDPTLALEDPLATFRGWARHLASLGVRRVEGDVVADDRVFAWQPLGEGWSWDDALWKYGAPVAGLQLNHDVVTITVRGGERAGDPVAVEVAPLPWCLPLETALETAPGEWSIARPPASPVTTLAGPVPPGSSRSVVVSIPDPPACFAETLRRALGEEGIAVGGIARRASAGEPSAGGTALFTHRSAPLRDLLPVMLKESDNLYAESIARALDPDPVGKTYDAEVVAGVLTSAGVPRDAHALVDGSGLSRMDLLSTEALVRLLRWSWRRPWRDVLLSALATPGEDGTLRRRMVGGPAEGRVAAKTGSMTGAFNVAGYVTDADGRTWVFAFLSNGVVQPGAAVRSAQDTALEVLASASVTEEIPRRKKGLKRR